MLITLVTIVHVFVCLVLVGVVLLQQGKGADMGAAFGGGSQTLFGAAGADNLLTRVTTGCAFLFMVTSIFLALDSKHAVSGGSSLFQNVQTHGTQSETAKPSNAEKAPAASPDSTNEVAAPVAPAASAAATSASTVDSQPQASVAAQATEATSGQEKKPATPTE